jgi:murein DD-endopeptidase MepM/ murein hydrolase activator NlpD
MNHQKKPLALITLLLCLGLFFGVITNRNGNAHGFVHPMERYEKRPKLLTFGLYVTPDPARNPINPPERFEGYHTALDLEVFPEELDQAVPVFAACQGEIVEKSESEGYGGVVIQNCKLDNETVTVLYGHLALNSIHQERGQTIKAGTKLGILGDNKSAETSFTRKHLHFQIHKGDALELRGYVQSESELSSYINPEEVLK